MRNMVWGIYWGKDYFIYMQVPRSRWLTHPSYGGKQPDHFSYRSAMQHCEIHIQFWYVPFEWGILCIVVQTRMFLIKKVSMYPNIFLPHMCWQSSYYTIVHSIHNIDYFLFPSLLIVPLPLSPLSVHGYSQWFVILLVIHCGGKPGFVEVRSTMWKV